MTTIHLRNSISPECFWGGLLIALVLCGFALSPAVQAVSPPPDGGYPGGNTAEGDSALLSLTTGSGNTANGSNALKGNTTGSFNTANGVQALLSNTTGTRNTATGVSALDKNTTGGGNTANGYQALFNNTTGRDNTANGAGALGSNTTGYYNTANGNFALGSNTSGHDNTADGFDALVSNTTGTDNAANGSNALASNTSGHDNTANGVDALESNTTGSGNTAEGSGALPRNTGSNNIGLGTNAGAFLTTGSNNIDIGALGVAGESTKIRIGTVGTQTATFIAGIHGVAVTGAAVVVNGSGQLGVAPSSERFKDEIKPMDKASEAILTLKPVTFRYKKEIDPKGTSQFGLVAEDVEKVNPDLVVRDAKGKIFTVRYEAVNAMLLNEFLKEHRKVEQQEAGMTQLKGTVAKQEATIAKQEKQIEALTAGLQRVNAQVEMSRPAPQMALNNQ